MKNVSLPKFSQKERHNARCFEDFKNYIQTYIDNPDEKRYHQYSFDSEIVKEKNPELYKTGDYIILSHKGNRKELEVTILHAFSTMPTLEKFNAQEVLGKLDECVSIYTEEEKELVYGMIKLAKIEDAIAMLANSTVEQLREMSNSSLPKIVVA